VQLVDNQLKTRGVELKISHKYAGKAQQTKLKNRMVRQVSRRPRLKTTGPSVPAENLIVQVQIGGPRGM